MNFEHFSAIRKTITSSIIPHSFIMYKHVVRTYGMIRNINYNHNHDFIRNHKHISCFQEITVLVVMFLLNNIYFKIL